MKLWKYDSALAHPREVECPNGRWPASDEDGQQCFINSHFDTEDACWEHEESEIRAGLSLYAGSVTSAEDALRKAKDRAAAMCVEAAAFFGAQALRKKEV